MTTNPAPSHALRDALVSAVSHGGPLWPWLDSFSFAVDLTDLKTPEDFETLDTNDLVDRYLESQGVLIAVVDETPHHIAADELTSELAPTGATADQVADALKAIIDRRTPTPE